MRTIEDILASRPNLKVDVDKIINHPLIAEFQQENDIAADMLRRSLPKLSKYLDEQKKCAACAGLEACPNMVGGHCSQLVGYEGYIDIQLRKCAKQEAYEEAEKRRRLFKSHKVPKDVTSATFEAMDFDPDRLPVIRQVLDYCKLFVDGNIPRKGLYIHGTFGIGKSHMAAALANQLTSMGVDSFMVYVPEFAKEIYASFKSDVSTDELIDAVKDVRVLILDDIGAENLNPYLRDDVLGNILQHRMSQHLPTVYTSNLSPSELQQHLSYTPKGGTEIIKARRIMERIRHFVKVLEVKGTNRREEAI